MVPLKALEAALSWLSLGGSVQSPGNCPVSSLLHILIDVQADSLASAAQATGPRSFGSRFERSLQGALLGR